MARLNGDPAIRAKANASIKRSFASPAVREQMSIRAKIVSRQRMADPDKRAMYAKLMKERIQPLSCTPEALARRDLKAQGKAISKAKLAWCPEGYRDLYISLMRNRGIKKDEARRMVLEQRQKDLAELSPFERQMRALQRGAQLVANDQAPSLANPANYGEARWTA